MPENVSVVFGELAEFLCMARQMEKAVWGVYWPRERRHRGSPRAFNERLKAHIARAAEMFDGMGRFGSENAGRLREAVSEVEERMQA